MIAQRSCSSVSYLLRSFPTNTECLWGLHNKLVKVKST